MRVDGGDLFRQDLFRREFLRLEMRVMIAHGLCSQFEIVCEHQAGDIGCTGAVNGVPLGLVDRFADEGGHQSLEQFAGLGQILALLEIGTTEGFDEFHGRFGVGLGEVDDAVDSTGAQEGRFNVFRLVGGEDRDDWRVLRVDTVKSVQQFVHAVIALVDNRVDIFDKDDGGSVHLGHLEAGCELIRGLQIDEGPTVVLALFGDDFCGQSLAGAEGALEQRAVFDGDSVLHADLGVFDQHENTAFEFEADHGIEDQLCVRNLHELGRIIHEIERTAAIVPRQIHVHGVAAIDGLVAQKFFGLVDDFLRLAFELPLHLARDHDLRPLDVGLEIAAFPFGWFDHSEGRGFVAVRGWNFDEGRSDVLAPESFVADIGEAVHLAHGAGQRNHTIQRKTVDTAQNADG